MRNLFLTITVIVTLTCTVLVSSQTLSDSQGRAIEFLVEENGARLKQFALIQDGKISLKQAGGNPSQDILFNVATRTLYIIDNQNRSYYAIDENVINKVSFMIDSISSAAETQQGVLSDLLTALGFVKEEGDVDIVVKDTAKKLSAANIECHLYQEFRNGVLQSELCIATRENLSALGEHYETLNALYIFGDKLLNKAGKILSNMGFAMPRLSKLQKEGLPVLIYMVREKAKISLIEIREQNSDIENFELPGGYARMPIPFIG